MLERRTGRSRRRGVEPDKGKNGSPTILPKLMCVCRRSGTTTMKGTVFVGGAQEMDGRIKASSCLLRRADSLLLLPGWRRRTTKQ